MVPFVRNVRIMRKINDKFSNQDKYVHIKTTATVTITLDLENKGNHRNVSKNGSH